MDAENGTTVFRSSKRNVRRGHDRLDVLGNRTIFLKRMVGFELQMPISSEKEMEIETWSVREPIIHVTHDESTFAAHDGQKNLWLKDGHQSLRKKELKD